MLLNAVANSSTGLMKLPSAKVAFVPLVVVVVLCISEHMDSSYLVDPASSHMLVSKIKPCMSKYKQLCTVKLRMAH